MWLNLNAIDHWDRTIRGPMRSAERDPLPNRSPDHLNGSTPMSEHISERLELMFGSYVDAFYLHSAVCPVNLM